MCLIIPKVCLPSVTPSIPQKYVYLCLRCCVMGSQTQPTPRKCSGSPCLSPPLLSHVLWEILHNYFILRDYILTIGSLPCLKGYVNIHKRHVPYPKSGDISGICGQQVGEIFQPLMGGGSHWCPPSLSMLV